MYKVLFAEDELLVRIGLQNAISWGKYSMELVAQADDGQKAFELFQKIKPDLVITDIKMDGMDGYELIQKIRELDKECAIIVISCMDDFELIRKLVPLKINGYVLKASINMKEVDELLTETKDYLVRIGRIGEGTEKKEFLEKRLKKYLIGEGEEPIWSGSEKMKYLCQFSLKKEDEEKINRNAISFIKELMGHQFGEGTLLNYNNPTRFLIFLPKDTENMEKRAERIMDSIESFLGIIPEYYKTSRLENESIIDWFKRHEEHREEDWEQLSTDSAIGSVIRYMNEHHGEALSLPQAASIAGMAPNYFSSLFKKVTGKNYVEYLNGIRLNAVLKEFKKSDDKVSVIAEKHGFPNQEHFSKYFKKKMGMSPSQWRRQNS